ncbi:putative hydroxypyruvate isomerase isoform X3 [Epinephelus fuscoguttatus]|uniref:putative hydroxypyruvate isomerase isoform X3 n=1 Tax=Epinephelus fuscoguttatus TaxID=293821 RepID=UPI0020D18781|nr:putative hydroxypyruvate isomerase isoform X3 [Epinephelus fuscoguttatus]XP_049444051.1 putative hydroxypyruvate isomerase isoform X3 [Epinephelus fuscoguttatus]
MRRTLNVGSLPWLKTQDGSTEVVCEYFVAVHGAPRLQSENIRGCLGWLSGGGGSLALRLRPAGASESQRGYRSGGNIKKGELGLGAVPGREAEFRQGLDQALKYARALNCTRIHLMAGRVPGDSHRTVVAKEMESIFVQNLNYAADILSKEGITGLIEPINTRITDPRYFLDSPHQAAAILEKVGKPNIKLQMDVFHWQIMDGNLTQNIHKYFPIIGHVQIAQVPGRNEPDSAGELNYSYLFSMLENLDYQGYIGCEYKPLCSTKEGLGWIKDYCTHSRW